MCFRLKIVYNLPGNEIRSAIIFFLNGTKKEEEDKKARHSKDLKRNRKTKQSTSTRFHSIRTTKKKCFVTEFCFLFWNQVNTLSFPQLDSLFAFNIWLVYHFTVISILLSIICHQASSTLTTYSWSQRSFKGERCVSRCLCRSLFRCRRFWFHLLFSFKRINYFLTSLFSFMNFNSQPSTFKVLSFVGELNFHSSSDNRLEHNRKQIRKET